MSYLNKIKDFNWLFFIIILVISSCNSSYPSGEDEALFTLRKDITRTLSRSNGRSIVFQSKDTFIEIDKTVSLSVFKTSFINADSSIYSGQVNLVFKFQSHPDSVIKELKSYPDISTGLYNVFGSIYFSASGQEGEHLLLNPSSPPLLYFPYYSHLFSSIKGQKIISSQFDTGSTRYEMELLDFTPLVVYSKRNINIETEDYFYYNDLIDLDSFRKSKSNTIRTFGDTIAYTLTLKAGLSFLAWQEWGNSSPVQINVIIENLSSTIEDGFIKVLIISKPEIAKNFYTGSASFYMVGERSTGSVFAIKKPENPYHFKTLRIPLDRKYTLFVYGTKDGKFYSKTKSNIKLKSSNNLKIKLEEVSKEELLKQLNNL